MIFVKATNHFETRSDKPNENWTDNLELQVIPDGSELANKIIENYPFFEPVLDKNGLCRDKKKKRKSAIPLPPEDQIGNLKAQLSASDYKIIKCMECSLAGEELPYNIEELHAERQALRDSINELEASL